MWNRSGRASILNGMCLNRLRIALSASLCLGSLSIHASSQKAGALPAITLDEFMNTTEITDSKLSPDGTAAVIATEAPDWKASVFRHDLWLWTAQGGLKPLTHSGSEEEAQWSPDGKWIAFISDRALPDEDANAEGDPASDADKADRIWIIPVAGGEALPLFTEKLDVHAFAWSPDGAAIYYSVTAPLTAEQQEEQKDEWKDVTRWREQHRGDLLVKQEVAPALKRALELAPPHPSKAEDKKDAGTKHAKKKTEEAEEASSLPPGTETIARQTISIGEIAPSLDGKTVAFVTEPVHHRMESPADYEIFLVSAAGGAARQLTHNQASESGLRWSADSGMLYFLVQAAAGSLEGKYRDVQGRLYRMNPADGKIDRLGAEFDGSFAEFTLLPDGREIALGLKGTQTQLYKIDGEKAEKLPGMAGTYSSVEAGRRASAILVRYSKINQPEQAYLASDPEHPDRLTALTSFNPVFAERAQPEWQPYTWKSDDGQTIEGVLIFPPGMKGAKHLRMFTFIHGGPADADGDRFGADWYDWATLAATNGWLVFRPNYRGSAGYGDDFMLEIMPHLVSKPGRDILAGVDALVKDGYADPDHLAIGGYSYGGYMTNWLITQTTRFKAAVTGAGAVEHAANWGNDDETWDDAWYLGGQPWENPDLYQSEAALFRFDRVKTPTHLVQGGADVRVSYLEGVTMERALQALGISHAFLVFPGEGHGLGKNPWHGYIKVREELKWLEKYAAK
jgi:dipeptidyl aminopeptidase/acylaminoacyl peptidase